MKLKRLTAALLALLLCAPCLPSLAEEDAFAARLAAMYAEPAIEYRTEVRWWMAEGAHTDETLLEEVQAIYDAGFRGMELCEQVDPAVAETQYGYGSGQWDHDLKLVLNRALDLGMTVSLTSGTNWATANIPGLDPQSQAASQMVFVIEEYLKAGKTRSGAIPMEKKAGTKKIPVQPGSALIGVYAYRQTTGNKAVPILFAPEYIDLTPQVTTDADGVRTLDFTPPDAESNWRVLYYWQQGAAQASSPAVEPAYCINYFDTAGVEALRAYWEEHILDDPALNAKILAGDVQLFMDSLEINPGDGCTFWAQDMAEAFIARKGYDIRPYLYLFMGLPDLTFWGNDGFGTYRMDGDEADSRRIMNDLFDVQTQLYMERMLNPLRDWLHGVGIETRAQISYGQRLEISEPTAALDYPEAENLNQNNQVDIYRLWSGAAKLQNKVLSSETGAVGGCNYIWQDHFMEAYDLFAAGFSRIIWHVWTAQYGPGEETEWPGYRVPGVVFRSFYPFGTREPSAQTEKLFNDHLARVQQFLRSGTGRTDVGMLYVNHQQTTPSNGNHGGVNWMLSHEPAVFPSTALQDAGYTYDYCSPALLTAEGVAFDPQTRALGQAGWRALVIWQETLPLDGARAVLALAEAGLPVVIVDGAAARSCYAADDDAELAAVMERLRALPCVHAAPDADGVLSALQAAGVTPYAGFTEPNRQLLTQARGDDEALYLYLYNYCDGSYLAAASDGTAQDTHGDAIRTEITADGLFVPYALNPWDGSVTRLGTYRHEDGRTIFPAALDSGSIALYVLRRAEEDSLHAVESNAERVFSDGQAVTLRAVESGLCQARLSDGSTVSFTAEVPAPREITSWQVDAELWSEGTERDSRTETLLGQTVTETSVRTQKTPVSVQLERLTGWENIPEIGDRAAGTARYTAVFDWDGSAAGAVLDLGRFVECARLYVNGQAVTGLSLTDGRADISPYLQTGENTVVIEYFSSLTNALGSGVPAGWQGYHTHPSMGPQQALLIPYAEAVFPAAD